MKEEQDLVIPLVKERVSTTKRNVETGRVRVSTHTDRHEEMVRVDLARDEVEVRSVPRVEEIDRLPEPREEGDVTIVPVVEERLVIEKKLVLVEEIHIRNREGRSAFGSFGKDERASRTDGTDRDKEAEGTGYDPRLDKSGL